VTILDPFALAADLIDPPPNPHLTDPAAWIHDRLDEHLWSKQIEIVEAVRDHRKVAVKACHGPGKSFTAARIVAWWLDCHPHGEAFAVTTAPTDSQVKAILWREITRAWKKGTLPGRVTLDAQWKIGEQLVAYGRKPADHDENGFQGIHDRYVLVVLDEACGIPKQLWTGTDTLVTNDDGTILAIGNPDNPASEFAEVCDGSPDPLPDGTTPSGMSKLGWWVITISVFDTPNFTGETIPDRLRQMLPGQVWLEERRQRWTETSPLWISKVLGQFPQDAADGMVPWSWLLKSQAPGSELRVPVEIGIDVGASEEGDETVIRARAGMHALPDVWRLQTGDSEEIVDRALDAIRVLHATSVKVDHTGVGFGVTGSLRRRVETEVGWPVEVHGVVVGEKAVQSDRFVNLKAEIWWEIGREYSRTGSWDLSDVDQETLLELAAPKFREVNKRVQVEEKSEVRRRIGRSTDNADSLLLAFYQPVGVGVATTSKAKDKRGRR
jgi:hypothetical protein